MSDETVDETSTNDPSELPNEEFMREVKELAAKHGIPFHPFGIKGFVAEIHADDCPVHGQSDDSPFDSIVEFLEDLDEHQLLYLYRLVRVYAEDDNGIDHMNKFLGQLATIGYQRERAKARGIVQDLFTGGNGNSDDEDPTGLPIVFTTGDGSIGDMVAEALAEDEEVEIDRHSEPTVHATPSDINKQVDSADAAHDDPEGHGQNA